MPVKERKVVNAPRAPLLWHIVWCLETTTPIRFHFNPSHFNFMPIQIMFSKTVFYIVWSLEIIDNANLHIMSSEFNSICSNLRFNRSVCVKMLVQNRGTRLGSGFEY